MTVDQGIALLDNVAPISEAYGALWRLAVSEDRDSPVALLLGVLNERLEAVLREASGGL